MQHLSSKGQVFGYLHWAMVRNCRT